MLGNWQDESGSGTIITVGLILMGLALLLGLAQVGVAASCSTTAQKAADLGAVIGATDLLAGGDGCSLAQEYIAKNGAEMTACTVDGWMLQVRARKEASFGLVGFATAQSRAGPEFAGRETWNNKGL